MRDAEITLADVPASDWDRIESRGFDAVYLMGVWRRSPMGRFAARTDPGLFREYDRALPGWSMQDVVGSPFSVQAYEPDERMGGWTGLDAARTALAQRGMALVVDFVTNHTAFDHEWIRSRPDLYVEGTLDDYRGHPICSSRSTWDRRFDFVACGRDPYFPPWRDVAQLNYFNPATRDAMSGVLESIAEHCDGVRCDMAMLVLNEVFANTWHTVDLLWRAPSEEFWPSAIARAQPHVPRRSVLGSRVGAAAARISLHLRQAAARSTAPLAAAEVRGHLQADPAYGARMVRFLENHDEHRSLPTFGARLPAAAAIAYAQPGMRFFFDGQFEGAGIRTPVQLGRWTDETARADVQELYRRLLSVIDLDVFHDGAWRLLDIRSAGDASYEGLVAVEWQHAGTRAVMASNVVGVRRSGLAPDCRALRRSGV